MRVCVPVKPEKPKQRKTSRATQQGKPCVCLSHRSHTLHFLLFWPMLLTRYLPRLARSASFALGIPEATAFKRSLERKTMRNAAVITGFPRSWQTWKGHGLCWCHFQCLEKSCHFVKYVEFWKIIKFVHVPCNLPEFVSCSALSFGPLLRLVPSTMLRLC